MVMTMDHSIREALGVKEDDIPATLERLRQELDADLTRPRTLVKMMDRKYRDGNGTFHCQVIAEWER